MGITEDKTGRETFIAAAFPSACGKTNMAMLTPSLPGYTVRCVGKLTCYQVSRTECNS